MLRIDRTNQTLTPLTRQRLPDSGLLERSDIQQMVTRNSKEFFEEMGENLLLIAEEVKPTDVVQDRIDILALDSNGAAVVLELKRGSHKLQLLQAISYAAMISEWEPREFIQYRARFLGKENDEVEDEVAEFLEEDITSINQSQRVILLAEDYDYEVLIAARWLAEQYGVDIKCSRIHLATDGNQEYLTCPCIYPPPEIADYARRRHREAVPAQWADWDSALGDVRNSDLVAYFKKELAGGRSNNLRRRSLRFDVGGKRRLHVMTRKDKAYVWQNGRFDDDKSLWEAEIGEHINLAERRNGTCLRFYLESQQDFNLFDRTVKEKLRNVKISTPSQIELNDMEDSSDIEEILPN